MTWLAVAVGVLWFLAIVQLLLTWSVLVRVAMIENHILRGVRAVLEREPGEPASATRSRKRGRNPSDQQIAKELAVLDDESLC